jgi:hypothetical protein
MVAVIAIAAIFILVWKNKISRFRIKAGPVTADLNLNRLQEDLKVIKESVAEVNKAVNHQKTGEPTLVDRVKNIEARLQEGNKNFYYQNECLRAIANHVGLELPEEQ